MKSELEPGLPISHPRNAITSIAVDRLFGWLSYDLPSQRSETTAGEIARLFVLYGDNGSGKTTLLALLHSLLSSEMKAGHRTRLAQTPFKRFAVGLASGMTVEAVRSGDELVGDYTLRFLGDAEVEDECPLVASEDLSIKDPQNEAALEAMGQRLKSLRLNLRFLRDDRRTRGLEMPADWEEMTSEGATSRFVVSARMLKRMGHLDEQGGLASAIENLETWIRHSALTGSKVGEKNINTIYTDVVRRIATVPLGGDLGPESDRQELVENLKTLARRNNEFSLYRLTSDLQVDDLIHFVEQTPDGAINLLGDVLKPYLNGVQARLDALEEVKVVVDRLVNSVNRLFRYKKIRFDIHSGLEIVAHRDVILEPQALSSGEQQLLLLVSEAVVARGDQTVFIIDEPEISLNVKWQRRLIDTLLECIGDGPVQLIIATHSIELLSQHKKNVVRLDPSLDV